MPDQQTAEPSPPAEPLSVHITGASRLYPIVGDPVKYVESPTRLTRTLADNGHNGICLPMHVAAANLDDVMAALTATQHRSCKLRERDPAGPLLAHFEGALPSAAFIQSGVSVNCRNELARLGSSAGPN